MRVRGLVITGVASLALLSGAAHAAATAQLLDAGTGEKQALRYTYKAGASERATMNMNMQVALSLGGQQVPMAAIPPMRIQLNLRIAETSSDGSARLEFELVNAEAMGDATAAAQLSQSLAGLKGMAGWQRMDTQGRILESGVKGAAGAGGADATSMLNDLQQSMQQLAAPLPAEPVGLGARWQVVQQAEAGGMKLTQTVEYVLRSREGNRIGLDVKMVDSKVDASGGLPAGAKLDSVQAAGGGTSSIALDRLVPTATIDADTTVSVSSSAGGQGQSMQVKLKILQSIAPAAN
jgi:hypothetical protein